MRNTRRHFAHGSQAIYPLAVFQGAQVGRNVLNLNDAAQSLLHPLRLQGTQAFGRVQMELVGAMAWLPVVGGGPSLSRLQTRDQLGRSLVEMADFVVFNEDHRRRQGIEQHIQAFVGLKQVGAEVFHFAT